MKFTESINMALKALAANKLRSILTMLGIIIGVGAVITLLSVGNGVQAYITDQFQAIGTNLFFVIPGSIRRELTKPAYLTLKDANALIDPVNAPDVLRVSPAAQNNARVQVPGTERRLQISGTSVDYPLIRDWGVAQGIFFNESDYQAEARVAVIGSEVGNILFPDEDPLNQIIRINSVPFRIIGVMETRGGSGFSNEDEQIIIPLSTSLGRLFPARTPKGEPRISAIYVQAVSEEQMDSAMTEVKEILRNRHNIAPGDPDDFSAISQKDLIGTFQQITGVITTFLGAIAGISLLVGGIGIMNIMLVSVTERTREIGLRKAVGARRKDILGQFLIEAITLSMAGGLIGILLGAAGSAIISSLLASEGFYAVTTVDAVLLSTLFSAAVGLFFGIYPAQRAASLNPIQALRYE